MIIIIAGPRDVYDEDLVIQSIEESGWKDQITEVIHGGARGIDSAADKVCRALWLIRKFPAAWNALGKSAGPIRNRQMAQVDDRLIAIWNGDSIGTKNMIETMEKLGKPVFIKRIKE